MMKVVLLEPRKYAKVVEIEHTLENMQKVVGGYIEAVYPFEDEVAVICNEEGKLLGLPLNRALYGESSMKEMTYAELKEAFRAIERSGTNRHLNGRVVISQDSFTKPYSLESRTYLISSDNKAFQPNMGGYSIYATSLDGSDPNVRLESYLADERGGKDGWKIEKCYLEEPGPIVDILAGTCFICGLGEDNFEGLSEEQQRKYLSEFRLPEQFVRVNGEITAMPFYPREAGRER